VHFEEALGGVGVEDGPFSAVLGDLGESQSELIVVESLNIVLGPELQVALTSDLVGGVLLEFELGLHFDVLYPGDEEGGGGVGADFVPASIGLGDLEESEEGVLLPPLLGCCLVLEDDGDDEKPVLAEGQIAVEDQAQQTLFVLNYSDEVYVEYHLSLDVFEETGEDVLLLGSGQVGLQGDILVYEVEVGGVGLGYRFVVEGVLEEGGPEVGLDEGQKLFLRQLPLTFAINSCHEI